VKEKPDKVKISDQEQRIRFIGRELRKKGSKTALKLRQCKTSSNLG